MDHHWGLTQTPKRPRSCHDISRISLSAMAARTDHAPAPPPGRFASADPTAIPRFPMRPGCPQADGVWAAGAAMVVDRRLRRRRRCAAFLPAFLLALLSLCLSVACVSGSSDLATLTAVPPRMDIAFEAHKTDYDVVLLAGETSVSLAYTKADPAASVTLDFPPMPLTLPWITENWQYVHVTVQSSNPATQPKTYNVRVRLASTNALLSALSVPDSTGWTFDSNTFDYPGVRVPNGQTSATASATAVDQFKGAVVTWSPQTVSGLVVGVPQEIKCIVTAESNDWQEYTLQITRNSDVTLQLLSAGAGTMSPALTPGVEDFTLTLTDPALNITMMATPTDSGATLSWLPSNPVSLLLATTVSASVTVTSPDGFATKTYRVVITRPTSTNALLDSLHIAGSYDWSFSSITFVYGPVRVPYEQTTATAVAVPQDLRSTFSCNSLSGLVENVAQELKCTVIPESGSGQDYSLLIVRNLSNDTTLTALSVSEGTLDPTFDPSTWNYTVLVDPDVFTAQVFATPNPTSIDLQFNPSGSVATLPPTHPSHAVISVVVKAADGSVGSYHVSFTRDKHKNNTLSSLVVAGARPFSWNPDGGWMSISVPFLDDDGAPLDSTNVSVSLWHPSARAEWHVDGIPTGTTGFTQAVTLVPMVPCQVRITVWAEDTTMGPRTHVLEITRDDLALDNPVVSIARSVSHVSVGQSLRLQAQVQADPLTSAGDLLFHWSCSSHPQLLSNYSVPVSTADLLLPGATFAQPGTYSFSVLVTDSHPAHVNAQGAAPSSSASMSVPVTAAAAMTVGVGDASSGSDPCATHSPCINGGRCVATLQAAASVFQLSCVCPTAPLAFFGPTCAFALLACPNCVSPYSGGAELIVFGLGLDGLLGVRVADRIAYFQPAEWRGAEDPQAAQVLRSAQNQGADISHVQAFRLRTPALDSVSNRTSISAYQPLSVVLALAGSAETLQFNFSSLVFYTSQQCATPGMWRDDGMGGCLPCPQGGYCPGGGRVWPLPGYWSVSEYHAPLSCPESHACIGVDIVMPRGIDSNPTHTAHTGLGGTDAGYTDTQQCAVEYTGTQCVQCSDSHYMLQGQCYFCGASTDQTRVIAMTLLVAITALCVLAVAAAFLSARRLSLLMQLFTTLQSVAMVGVEGSRKIPFARKELATAFTYLNFINADIEILRPGCAGVPDFDWVAKLWLTLIFLLIVAALFLVACAVRLCVRVRLAGGRRRPAARVADFGSGAGVDDEPAQVECVDEQSAGHSGDAKIDSAALAGPDSLPVSASSGGCFRQLRATAEWTDFTWRVQHCMLILGCIFYLRLCTLFFLGFRCVMAADPLLSFSSDAVSTESLYLAEDLQTQCWHGEHMEAMAAVFILLAVYVVGLPVACFVLLMRNFADGETEGVLGGMWARFAILRGPHGAVVCSSSSDSIGSGGVEKSAAVWVDPAGLRSPTACARPMADHPSTLGCDSAGLASPEAPSRSPLAARRMLRMSSGGWVQPKDEPTLAQPDTSQSADSSSGSGSGGGNQGAESAPQDNESPAKLSAPASDSDASAAAAAAQALSESRSARFGYLFYSLRPASFAFCLTTFAMHVWVAAVTVFIAETDPRLKLFLFGLAWASLTMLTAAELPYIKQLSNVRKVLIGVGTLAHSTLLLSLQDDGSHSAYFFVLLALFVLIVLAVLFRRQIRRKLEPCLERVFVSRAVHPARSDTTGCAAHGHSGSSPRQPSPPATELALVVSDDKSHETPLAVVGPMGQPAAPEVANAAVFVSPPSAVKLPPLRLPVLAARVGADADAVREPSQSPHASSPRDIPPRPASASQSRSQPCAPPRTATLPLPAAEPECELPGAVSAEAVVVPTATSSSLPVDVGAAATGADEQAAV